MFKVVDKRTRELLQPETLFNSKRIKSVLINAHTDEVTVELKGGLPVDVTEHVYVLPNIVNEIYQFDYIVDQEYNLQLVDFTNCNYTIDDSIRIIGNKLFDSDLNLIYNTTKKYLYNKVQLKDSEIITKHDIKAIAVFGNEKVYLYLYFEFLSERHVKPIATLSYEKIELYNGTSLPQRDILNRYQSPKEYISSKKKSVAYELFDEVYNVLPTYLYEVRLTPVELIELTKDYKGYLNIYVPDPKLKLKSKLNEPKLMLISTKFPQITKAFDFDYIDFNISEQIQKGV